MEEDHQPATPPTNILPPGEKIIRLTSQEVEAKFHVSTTVVVPLIDETTAKRRQVLSEHGSPESPRPKMLPKGEVPIRLPSEECQEKFHVTAIDVVPLLDETTAKRRQVLSEHGTLDAPRPHVLPKGEKPIRLPSEGCEEQFHVTAAVAVPLLQDSMH